LDKVGVKMKIARRMPTLQGSAIREMTRLAGQYNAINLSQGYPDFPPPPELTEAAIEAIQHGYNQYAEPAGYPALRQKLAELYTPQLGWPVDPNIHVTITCGVTEAIVVAQMAIMDSGDEIIILEPAHGNFRAASFLSGANPVGVSLRAPDYRIERDFLSAAITPRTRAILLNTPHNPTGRVFDAEELGVITELVLKHDLVLITDEIYDHILYDGRQHNSPGSIEPLRDRTITISGLGKTFAVTGWRLGYIIAPTTLSQAVRPIHDYLTICAPTPLQVAALTALNLPQDYYRQMNRNYHERRDFFLKALHDHGFKTTTPEGAYYVLADYSSLPIAQAQLDPGDFALWLLREIGIATVPGTDFYTDPDPTIRSIRFAYSKRMETLHAAAERLSHLSSRG
jgi:aminotransferase